MSWWRFLKERWIFLLFQILLAAFFCFILSFANIGWQIQLLLLIGIILLTTGALLPEYLQRKRFYDQAFTALEQLDKKYLLPELLETPDCLEEELCVDLLHQVSKSMADEVAGYEVSMEEYRRYVETWIHEIKTPISAAEMLCRNHPGQESRAMLEQLHRIESYVEQALYYARSTSLEKDYVIRSHSLREIVSSAVKRHASQLIALGCTPVMDNLDIIVYADAKWVEFILGQLIANSIQYRSEKLYLAFSAENTEDGTWLSIADHGVGIAPQDQQRIFEKGFTGVNGRRFGKSTGIGLYLCKNLCEKMNLRITVSAEPGTGTTFRIFFPKNTLVLLE